MDFDRKAKWLSIPNGGLSETGLKDFGTAFKDKDILPSLVRESVQNSLDAKRQDADQVSVVFTYDKVNANCIPDIFRLRQIFGYCEKFVTSQWEKDFFELGMNTVLSGSAGTRDLGVLRIGDHGTIGLTGLADFNENGRFRGLVTRMGMGNDDGARGGNFGVGKQALFLASKVRTVVFSSLDETGRSGHMGVAKLSSFRDPKLGTADDGKPLCADRTVFYCDASYDPQRQKGNPVIDGQFEPLPSRFSKRSDGDYGTDVFIIGYDPKNEKQLANEILTVVLLEFFVSIAEGKLAVTLPNGFRLDKGNLNETYTKFQQAKPKKTDSRKIECYFRLLQEEWKDSPMIPVGPGIPAFPQGAIQYKFVKSDEDNFCRVTREKGMFVHTVKNVCGNANCVGIAVIRDKELNAVFKTMENESHVQFQVTNQRFTENLQLDRAQAQLNKLEEFLRECANAEMGAKVEARMAAVLPDELEEFMNICAGQVAVGEVKGKKVSATKPTGTRTTRHKHKPTKSVKADSAGLDDGGEDDEDNTNKTGIKNTGKKHNSGKHANPGGNRHVNPSSPEENGYAMRNLDIAPVFYASGPASSGRYRVTFTVPRSKRKICLCFSATTETDSTERLDVKSVSATDANGLAVPSSVDLGGTAIAFENVEKGQVITAEVKFDVSYYCYSQVRYYEKKNN